jgi:hypothetical protein
MRLQFLFPSLQLSQLSRQTVVGVARPESLTKGLQPHFRDKLQFLTVLQLQVWADRQMILETDALALTQSMIH